MRNQIGSVLKEEAKLGEKRSAYRRVLAQQRAGSLAHNQALASIAQTELAILRKQQAALVHKRRILSDSLQTVTKAQEKIGTAFKTVTVAMGALAVLKKPIAAASKSEQEFLGVAKQLKGARDEAGKLTELFYQVKNEIVDIARVSPLAREELAGLAEEGLKQGISREGLAEFVKVGEMASVAFSMPSKVAAENLGKIKTIYQMSEKDLMGLGDVVNYLDDEAQVEGQDLLDFLQRSGGVARGAGMSPGEAGALGSAFMAMGKGSATAATAFNSIVQKLSSASSVKNVSKGLRKIQAENKKIGNLINLNPTQIQKDMQKNASETILKVMRALENVAPEKRQSIILDMFGLEYSDDVALLIAGRAEYERLLKVVRSKEAIGSMEREYNAQKESLGAIWQAIKNVSDEIMTNIGNALLPLVKVLGKGLHWLLAGAAQITRVVGPAIAWIGGTAGGIIAATAAVKGFTIAIWGVKLAFSVLKAGAVLTPVGRVLVLLGALAGTVMTHWETISRWLPPLWDNVVHYVGGGISAILAYFEQWGEGFTNIAATTASAMFLPISFLGKVGGKIQALGGKLVWLGKLVMAHPLLLAVGLLATAALLVYKNWEPIKAFFTEVWSSVSASIGDGIEWVVGKFDELRAWLAGWVDAGVALFGLLRDGVGKVFDWIGEKLGTIMEGIQKASAWVDEKTAPAKDAYWSVRTSLSDGIEGLANWVSGTERVRADAPVPPKVLPPVAGRHQASQQNTVTIHVNQQPGENGEALAQRIAQAQARALAVRNRGKLHDQVVVY